MSLELALLTGILWAVSLGLWIYARIVLPRRMSARLVQSVKAFSRAIELRFPTHRGLTERVHLLCERVAERLGLSKAEKERLDLAVELRDIGLCAVPYRIGNGKPIEAWSLEEAREYERHPEISAAMLEKIPTLEHLAAIVGAHHVEYSQAPDSAVESRILKAVADYAWIERTQGEVAALDSLRGGSGTCFDPSVVEAIRQVLTWSSVPGEHATVH